MTLPKSLSDREYQKFVTTADGPAVRTTTKVQVDNVNLSAEMKVDSGHDLYLAKNTDRVDDLELKFDRVVGLNLINLQAVENKTKGWVYNTKGATITEDVGLGETYIELEPTAQSVGYPDIKVGDELEVVYRGSSRLTDKSQLTKITDGTTDGKITADSADAVVNNAFNGINTEARLSGFNGTTWDRIKSTTGALDVEVKNSTITVTNTELNKLTSKIAVVNLDDVTTDTDGSTLDISDYSKKSVWVNVSVNTGAVTVNIEVSPDGITWIPYDSKTYTATTGDDFWEINSYFPNIRTTTTSQADATVKTMVFARGI